MSLIKTNNSGFPSVFNDFFDTDKFFQTDAWFKDFGKSLPAVNIKETEKNFLIELAVPGFKKEDIKVHVENEIINIHAESKHEKSDEKERYTRKEFSYSSFSRSFSLPKTANGEKVNAKYENGVLHVEIAKKEEAIKQNNRKEISVN